MEDGMYGRRDQLDSLLDTLWRARGTDLLLTVGMPPQIRVHGELGPVLGHEPLAGHDTDALLSAMLTDEQLLAWHASREYDFSFSWHDLARVRGSAFSQ